MTTLAAQQLLGISEPDHGHLLADMRIADGGSVPAARYCAPRVEPEVGYLLGADLAGPDVTAADVLAATEAFVPRWKSSTAGSRTGASASWTRSPTTRPPGSCSGGPDLPGRPGPEGR